MKRLFLYLLAACQLTGAPIELTTPSLAQQPGIEDALGLNAAVVVRRPGRAVTPSYFKATANTGGSRMAALAAAIGTVQTGDVVELVSGSFTVASGAPLSSFAAVTGWTIDCREGASHVYTNPEDAGTDYKLFRGKRNVVSFGAVPLTTGGGVAAMTDNWSAFQAAANSCEQIIISPPYLFPSGRRLRSGVIEIPVGQYGMSNTWEVSPTCQIEGAGANYTQLWAIGSGWSTSEKFMIDFPLPSNPVVAANNLFYTGMSNLTLVGNRSVNTKVSGFRYNLGQGTLFTGLQVTEMALRGIVGGGGYFYGCWITNITKGPGMDMTAGLYADLLSVEHINPEAVTDANGIIPAVRLNGGIYEIGKLAGEEVGSTDAPGTTKDQVQLQILDSYSVQIGAVVFGMSNAARTHTLVKITGNSVGVNIGHIAGSHTGYTPHAPGTLIIDDSQGSAAGAGIAYTVATGTKCSYRQEVGSFFPGLDRVNTFSKNNLFGNPANFTDGVTVRSSLGDVSIVGGAYNTTRSTSFFNFNTPVPHNWNAGAMSLTAAGGLTAAKGFAVVISAVNPTATEIPAGYRQTWHNTALNEIRDWTNIGGTLYKSAAYTP